MVPIFSFISTNLFDFSSSDSYEVSALLKIAPLLLF